jgi:hypothetical protein
MSSFGFKPQQISESVNAHGHDYVPKVRRRSIARGLPFGRGIRVIEQESHLLVFRASHLLRALLFGLSALDAMSFVGVSALFLLIALFAAYVPSKKATRVDPMVALRYE